jgi:hypothetical protein
MIDRKTLRFTIATIITFVLIALVFVDDFPVVMLAAIVARSGST